VAALFAAYAVIALSMYLIVNPAGADVIHAIQGRYLLPLFPFLLFLPGCLPRPPGAARLPACLFVLPAVAMAIVNLYAVPSLVAHLYALPGP